MPLRYMMVLHTLASLPILAKTRSKVETKGEFASQALKQVTSSEAFSKHCHPAPAQPRGCLHGLVHR